MSNKKKAEELKKKIKMCEELLKEIAQEKLDEEYNEKIDDSLSDEEVLENPDFVRMEGSVLVFKNDEGLEEKKVNTDGLGSFILCDEYDGKDLEELDISEYNKIVEQDSLHNYDKTCKYFKKVCTAWGWGKAAMAFAAIFI